MSEEQVHQITVTKEDLSDHHTGGGIRFVKAEIIIDSSLPPYRREVALIHEVLGVYLGSVVSREDIEEIAESIADGLRQLEVE